MRTLSTSIAAAVLVSAGLCSAQEQAPPSNYKHLKSLQSFIGEWEGSGKIPESEGELAGQEFVMRLSYRWALNKNAQVVAFEFAAGDVKFQGRGLRGWDASTSQIKDYYFNSLGGHSTSVLRKQGDQWVYTDKGVEADGTSTSSEMILTFLDKNTMHIKLQNRKRGDDSLPDNEVTFKRVTKAKGKKSAARARQSGASSVGKASY